MLSYEHVSPFLINAVTHRQVFHSLSVIGRLLSDLHRHLHVEQIPSRERLQLTAELESPGGGTPLHITRREPGHFFGSITSLV